MKDTLNKYFISPLSKAWSYATLGKELWEILYEPQRIIVIVMIMIIIIITTTTTIAASFIKEEWSKYPEHVVFVEQRNRMVSVISFPLYIYLSPQSFIPLFYLLP